MNTFNIRIPSKDEILATFGSIKNAIRCTHCDLPTALHFIANPEKAEGFVSPGGRRVGFPEFGKMLREWRKQETKQSNLEKKTMFFVSNGTNRALVDASTSKIAVDAFIKSITGQVAVSKVTAKEAIDLSREHADVTIIEIPVKKRSKKAPTGQRAEKSAPTGGVGLPAGAGPQGSLPIA